MKATDYIFEFLTQKGVTDLFGYPGGVVCHLMDSATKYGDRIRAHTNYHEQGAAFAACGYAQSSQKLGVAYATSGPGATNLLTGVADAFYDGLPVLFLTGQVDTYGSKAGYAIRQRGFQETDIVAMAKPVTKWAVYVEDAKNLPAYLEHAYEVATSGRPGPVLLDLPADVQRSDIEDSVALACLQMKAKPVKSVGTESTSIILEALEKAKRPCILAGAGILQSGGREQFRALANTLQIPVVSSMNALGVLPFASPYQFGFVGANGHRCANQIMAQSDLILALGSRLDLKQVGNNRSNFLKNATLIRVEIDEGELSFPVRNDEISIHEDLSALLPALLKRATLHGSHDHWLTHWQSLKPALYAYDYEVYHHRIAEVSRCIPDGTQLVTDCGQSQLWTMQAVQLKENQTISTTGGLGAMGYALPAGIGTYYANRKPVVCFAGDGGFQMNLQELQFLKREELPVKIVVLNNQALGMIRHFQEMNFGENYTQTTAQSGYTVPSFQAIIEAYGLDYYCVEQEQDVASIPWGDGKPAFVEIKIPEKTYLLPRFGRNNGFSDAEPLLPEALMKQITETEDD